jgi:hypothetical protein
MQKPDGLIVLESQDLPEKLFSLSLTDFPGINRRMEARLSAAGIFTAKDLCTADRRKIRSGFGSVVGERWWHLLRGADLPMEEPDVKDAQEMEAHRDDQQAADDGEEFLVLSQHLTDESGGRADDDEHRRKTQNKGQRGKDNGAPGSGFVAIARELVEADPGKITEISRDQRQDAGRQERDQTRKQGAAVGDVDGHDRNASSFTVWAARRPWL